MSENLIKIPDFVHRELQEMARWRAPGRNGMSFIGVRTNYPDGSQSWGGFPAWWMPWNRNRRPQPLKPDN